MADELKITLKSNPRKVTLTTGRKIVAIENSDDTYQETEAAGGTHELPDITVTQADDTTATLPSAKDLDVDDYLGNVSTGLTKIFTGATSGEQNTFVDNNTFAIITHIYDSANATAVIARMTNPVIAEEAAMSKFVTLLGAMWDLADDFHCYNVQTETNALTGWKMKMLANVNNCPHTPGTGFGYNGIDQYINSNFNPSSDAVKYTQNDALLAAKVVSIADLDTSNIFGVSDGTRTVNLLIQATPRFVWGVNESGATFTNHSIDSDKLITITRTASNVIDIYEDSCSFLSDTDVSNGLPNGNIYVGARNNSSVADNFLEGVLSSLLISAAVGFDHLLYKVQLDKLNSDLAAI